MWTMAAKKGFGSIPDAPRVPSERSNARDAAGSRLDAMREKGMPEFSIWFRLLEKDPTAPDDPDAPDFPWLPVGSLSIPRSGDINKAIYNVEDDLMSGLYKLFPNAKGKEEFIELGYQNKNFTDEDIQVAVRPTAAQTLVNALASKLKSFFSPNK
jgi:hypothetical protein